jgi:hypothetical protein
MATPFGHAQERLMIGRVDGGLGIEAQYNPADLQRDKPATWTTNGGVGTKGHTTGRLSLEYTGSEPRTMTLALLFDTFEHNTSIEPMVEALESLATPTDPKSNDEMLRAPPLCVVAWGDQGLKPFRCVVESVSTKYTMFNSLGVPLRATCTVKVKEAHIERRDERGRFRESAA